MLTTLADTAPNLNKYFMRFKEFITETFVNIIGFDDTAQANKEKYKDIVWQLLQKSYASIGGIKGSGFANRFGRLQCEQENL